MSKDILKPPHSNRLQGLINSVSPMFEAHPKLNILLQLSDRSQNPGVWKLHKDSEGYYLVKTELHLVSQPCMIVG